MAARICVRQPEHVHQSRTFANNFQFQQYGGALSSMSFGNGTSQTFVLNNRLQTTSQTLSKGSEVVQKYDYEYGQLDSSGNIISNSNNGQLAKIESHIGTVKQWTQKFSYDSIGRLSEAKEYRGDTNALSYKQNFDFDRFGNLYRKSASNPTSGQATPLSYTPIEDSDISKSTNQFTSNTTYDDAGYVKTDNKFREMSFNYDANGRMVKASKASVPDALSVYDASGMRVAEKVNDIWRFLIYDVGGKLVAEYGGLQSSDEGGVKYLLSDWQGSNRAILSNAGFVQGRMDYQAFGEEISSGIGLRTIGQGFANSNNLRQKYGLTERDEATGLDSTWFRKHENRAGRWTLPDPYNGSMTLGNPQSFNRYSYVGNQPTNFVDPSGLDGDDEIPEEPGTIYIETHISRWGPGHRTRSGGTRGGGPFSSGRGGGSLVVVDFGKGTDICKSLSNSNTFNTFAKEMWEKGSKNEAVGIFGERFDDGSQPLNGSADQFYTYKISPHPGNPGSTSDDQMKWERETIKQDKDIIYYAFVAHTHPSGANRPSTEETNGKGRGDTQSLADIRRVTGQVNTLGIVITDKKFAVFNGAGNIVCTGDWK